MEGAGFEPAKHEAADLQSAGFDRSPTPPSIKKSGQFCCPENTLSTKLKRFVMLLARMSKKNQNLVKHEITKVLSKINKESLIEIILLERIQSTNDEAKKRLNKLQKTDDCLAVFAEQQDSGRGRDGKKWQSPSKVNIYLSFSWASGFKPNELDGLSLGVAVEISKSLKPLLGEEIKIKWPNDLFLSEKKVGGILVETSKRKNGTNIIIGVGLNVLMSDKNISIDQDWTSLSLHYGKHFDRSLIAGYLLESLLNLKANFAIKGFDYYRSDFEKLHLLKNQKCLVTLEDQIIIGVVTGISEVGELIIKEGRKIHTLRFGEVSVKKIDA